MSASREELQKVDWRRVFAEALKAAVLVLALEDAREAVAAGIARIFEGRPPWDPSGPSLVDLIVAVGFNLHRNERRKGRGARPPNSADGHTAGADALYDDSEFRARRYAKLRAVCAEDALELQVVDAECSGICGLKAQVAHLGLAETVVRNARKRVARKVEEVKKQDRDAEGA